MNELLKHMQSRQSSRMPFNSKHRIEKQDILKILEAGRWAPTPHNMQNYQIIVVDDEKILEFILNIKRPISETFIRENYIQLSFSEEELLRKKTGILAANFPPSWVVPDFKLSENDEKTIQMPFPPCSLMMIIVYDPAQRAPASEGDFLGILGLGCLMENMWLMANSLGIGFHIVSSLNAVEDEVKKILDIPNNFKIAFSCRLGYPVSTPSKYLRVRRDITDFAYYNKFGNKSLK